MGCPLCTSRNQAEFPTEVAVHVSGLKSPDKPTVFLFPEVLICLDCGFSTFRSPENELRQLKEALPSSAAA